MTRSYTLKHNGRTMDRCGSLATVINAARFFIEQDNLEISGWTYVTTGRNGQPKEYRLAKSYL